MSDNFTRSLKKVLGFMARMCPSETRDWGAAMIAELDYVRGPFASLWWAAGCAATLLKHSAVVLVQRAINERSTGQTLPVALEGRMKKSTTIFILVLTAASFLFLLAPGFRQAFQLSGTAWRMLLFSRPGQSAVSPQVLVPIEKQARKTHDAQALAFVALHESNLPMSGRLAEQAVEWDPQLTWVYAGLVYRRLGTPTADRWIRSLQNWTPDNAVPYLLEAAAIRRKEEVKNNWRPGKTRLQELPGWVAAMRKAFSVEKYNSYLSDTIHLDRAVLARFDIWNPYAVLDDVASSYSVPFADIKTYAQAFPIREGQALEARGEYALAEQKYWSVARFGRLLELQGQTDADRFAAASVEYEAYQRLLPLVERRNDRTEASLLRLEMARVEEGLFRPFEGRTGHSWGGELSLRRAFLWTTREMRWEAATVQFSALLFLLSGLALLVSCLYVLGKRWRSRSRPSRQSPVVSGIGIISATSLLLSSVSLYLAFRPYNALFNRFMAGGSARTLEAFASFGIGPQLFSHAYNLRVYFWYGVIGTGVIGLFFVIARHFRHRLKPQVSNAR